MLRVAAIVPVKTFSRAKSRLGLPAGARSGLCALMLEELLRTLSLSPAIEETVVVTGEPAAASAAGAFGATVIPDPLEAGVNEAVSLADVHVRERGIGATVVLPQDIPLTKAQDIDFLLSVQSPPSFVTVVPSRKFDGTNALVRMPPDVMGTSYDRGSYRDHMEMARGSTGNASLLFVRRMMADIDDMDDVRYALGQGEKPELCRRINEIVGAGGARGA